MGIVIMTNLMGMCIRTQYREMRTAHALGLRDDDGGWEEHRLVFDTLEYVFSSIYLIELGLRACFLGMPYFRNTSCFLDACVVIITSIEAFAVSSDGALTPVLRFFRMARVARFAKMTRVAEKFGELRVITRTLAASIRGLFWSVLLCFFIIMAGGLLITELLAPFMEDPKHAVKDREYMFGRYGSSAKATYTMFEHSFTGRWTTDARKMIEGIDALWVFFWIVWTVGVNFAVMRVIAALFLKQTLAVASDDAQKVAVIKMKERQHFAEVIRSVFAKADSSGDGAISEKEFVSMIYDPEVADNFIKLGLELFEITMLFRLLSDEDGVADYDEFLRGAMQLNSGATNVDIIKILHETATLRAQIAKLAADIDPLNMPHNRDARTESLCITAQGL